jgi:cytochrome c oxidase subunit 2
VSEAVVSTAGTGAREPRHGARIVAVWALLTAIVVPLVIWVVGPHIPPGDMSRQSHDQHVVNVVLTTLATPVLLMIWVYFGYAIRFFRQPGGDAVLDGPPIAGNARIQLAWLLVTGAMVLGLAVYGTAELFSSGGAGGGEGPNPVAKPAGAAHAMQIQVIGQQWLWTFRYPGYGGVETTTLELPLNRLVEFHVTSLDVQHSFWAIELGVKSDAVQGSDNAAYAQALHTGSFQIRCAELCGLWHGHMYTSGHVVTAAAFSSWIAGQQRQWAGATKLLPPYAPAYFPIPTRNAG